MTEEKAKEATEEKKDAEKEKAKLSKSAEEVMKAVEEMTVLELAALVKALEEKFGISAALPAMALAPGAVAGAPAPEEKSTFDVVLTKVGDKKIQVIKEIRTVTNLGLKEAKDLVEQAPKPVKEGISKDEAEAIKKKLESVGASAELK